MAIPVGIDDARWLVVHRFMAGAAIDQTDDPFQLEQFEGIADAVTRYAIVPRDHQPMLLTAPDGRILVISLRQPETRRRAAGR